MTSVAPARFSPFASKAARRNGTSRPTSGHLHPAQVQRRRPHPALLRASARDLLRRTARPADRPHHAARGASRRRRTSWRLEALDHRVGDGHARRQLGGGDAEPARLDLSDRGATGGVADVTGSLDTDRKARTDVTGSIETLEVPLGVLQGVMRASHTVEVSGGCEPVQQRLVRIGDLGEPADVDVVQPVRAVIQDVVASRSDDVEGHERSVHDHRADAGVAGRELDRHHLAQAEVVVELSARRLQQVGVAVDGGDHVVVALQQGP